MRICATRFRENSNINTFVMHSQKKKESIIIKFNIKRLYYYLKVVLIIFSHFFSFFQICRIYKALIITIIYEYKHSFLRRLIL